MVNIEEAPDGSENMGPIGAIANGATFRYVFTSNDGQHFVRVATLMAQSSYNSFNLPYVYNGIGHTTNFIENLNVAIALRGNLDEWKVVTPIIPNCHVIIFADGDNYKSGAKTWITEQLVSPDKVLFQKVLPGVAII